jgi:hypothetical protein
MRIDGNDADVEGRLRSRGEVFNLSAPSFFSSHQHLIFRYLQSDQTGMGCVWLWTSKVDNDEHTCIPRRPDPKVKPDPSLCVRLPVEKNLCVNSCVVAASGLSASHVMRAPLE